MYHQWQSNCNEISSSNPHRCLSVATLRCCHSHNSPEDRIPHPLDCHLFANGTTDDGEESRDTITQGPFIHPILPFFAGLNPKGAQCVIVIPIRYSH